MLAEHRRLLRGAFGQWGGHEVDTQGDAFFVAFPSALAAIGAAVDSQRALAVGNWPPGTAVRVRMGLHTGEPALEDGGYVGMDVHRGARIAAAAHGGQVLISRRTAELVAEALPAGVSLRDLGDHRLKDMGGPTRLFQVVVDGLPDEFPGVRSLDVPTNLLPEPTSFVGRQREQADVLAALRRPDVRLLTLIGPGGTGKTRLALRASASLLDDFPDGVVVVPLAAVSDPEGVVPAVAAALAIADPGTGPLLDVVRGAILGKRLLLVLDNFEQVLAAAPLVGLLLEGRPKALVTSREPLHIAGEHEYPVPTLDPREAITLFAQRAEAVQPGFTVDGSNAAVLAELCAGLDHLPLAIELAASRVRLLSPHAMVARLGRRLQLLKGGPSDVPARQRTLRDTIDWSYELLEPGQRATFRALAVFVGGCTVPAAAAVLPLGGDDALEVLASLADKSLVRIAHDADGEPRFRMLETIREFALDQLAEHGEEAAVRRRFGEHFLELAEAAEPELRGRNQLEWLRRIDDELDNLRFALGWALDPKVQGDVAPADLGLRLAGALGWYCYSHGHVVEGCQWLEAALARAEGDGAARAKAMHLLGVLLDQRAQHARAVELFEGSLALYRQMGARAEMARELNSLGVAAMAERDLSRSRTFLEESLALRRQLGDPAGLSTVLANLGVLATEEEDVAGATAYYEESLSVDQQLGDVWGVAVTLGNLGALALARGDVAGAGRRIAEALRSLLELGDTDAVADCLEKAVGVASATGRSADAVRLAAAAGALREQISAPLARSGQAILDGYLAAPRAELDAAVLETVQAEGGQLDLRAATELALHVADGAAAGPGALPVQKPGGRGQPPSSAAR